LEGSVAIAGAAITWLRDNVEIISDYRDVEKIANDVPDSGGVYFVPAFQGLYAPYWDPNASGLMIGLSQFTRKSHIVRATLESISFQTVDILSLMRSDATGIMIDGGMSCNDLLCQILADSTGMEIIRPQTIEATALGAAMISGHTLGLWELKENVGPLDDVEEEDESLGVRRPRTSSFLYDMVKKPMDRVRRMSSITISHYPKGSDVFRTQVDTEYRFDRLNAWRLAIERSMKWTKIKKQEQKRTDYRRRSTLPIGFFLISSFGLLVMSNYLSNI
jgi:glycerol kinase